MVCASGTLMLASWLSGVCVPSVLDRQALDEGGRRAAGPDRGQVALECLERPMHAPSRSRRMSLLTVRIFLGAVAPVDKRFLRRRPWQRP